MRITVEFESMEEFEAFRTSGKKTRTKKEEADENVAAQGNAPAPLAPPAGAQPGFNPGATTGFAPPAAGAATLGAFPAAGAPTVAPEVVALVNRIKAVVDSAIAKGQPVDQMLGWFRSQCGAEAANYTMDQIKDVALPKMAVPALEQMAKLMNA